MPRRLAEGQLSAWSGHSCRMIRDSLHLQRVCLSLSDGEAPQRRRKHQTWLLRWGWNSSAGSFSASLRCPVEEERFRRKAGKVNDSERWDEFRLKEEGGVEKTKHIHRQREHEIRLTQGCIWKTYHDISILCQPISVIIHQFFVLNIWNITKLVVWPFLLNHSFPSTPCVSLFLSSYEAQWRNLKLLLH